MARISAEGRVLRGRGRETPLRTSSSAYSRNPEDPSTRRGRRWRAALFWASLLGYVALTQQSFILGDGDYKAHSSSRRRYNRQADPSALTNYGLWILKKGYFDVTIKTGPWNWECPLYASDLGDESLDDDDEYRGKFSSPFGWWWKSITRRGSSAIRPVCVWLKQQACHGQPLFWDITDPPYTVLRIFCWIVALGHVWTWVTGGESITAVTTTTSWRTAVLLFFTPWLYGEEVSPGRRIRRFGRACRWCARVILHYAWVWCQAQFLYYPIWQHLFQVISWQRPDSFFCLVTTATLGGDGFRHRTSSWTEADSRQCSHHGWNFAVAVLILFLLALLAHGWAFHAKVRSEPRGIPYRLHTPVLGVAALTAVLIGYRHGSQSNHQVASMDPVMFKWPWRGLHHMISSSTYPPEATIHITTLHLTWAGLLWQVAMAPSWMQTLCWMMAWEAGFLVGQYQWSHVDSWKAARETAIPHTLTSLWHSLFSPY